MKKLLASLVLVSSFSVSASMTVSEYQNFKRVDVSNSQELSLEESIAMYGHEDSLILKVRDERNIQGEIINVSVFNDDLSMVEIEYANSSILIDFVLEISARAFVEVFKNRLDENLKIIVDANSVVYERFDGFDSADIYKFRVVPASKMSIIDTDSDLVLDLDDYISDLRNEYLLDYFL